MPADISWLLYKLPDPRGIYIPRLLSIIRHLSLFFPLLHQTPQTCCGKILISVPMTWHRAIEVAMQTEREEDGSGAARQKCAESDKRDAFRCVAVRVIDKTGSRLIWRFTCLFLKCAWVCVWAGTEIRSALRSGVCQQHQIPFLVTQPKKGTSIRHGIPCCSSAYQSVWRKTQLGKGGCSYQK